MKITFALQVLTKDCRRLIYKVVPDVKGGLVLYGVTGFSSTMCGGVVAPWL